MISDDFKEGAQERKVFLMKKTKLSVKLIGCFLIVALIVLIIGFVSWREVSQTSEALNTMLDRTSWVQTLNLINAAQRAIQRSEICLLIPEFFMDEKSGITISRLFRNPGSRLTRELLLSIRSLSQRKQKSYGRSSNRPGALEETTDQGGRACYGRQL